MAKCHKKNVSTGSQYIVSKQILKSFALLTENQGITHGENILTRKTYSTHYMLKIYAFKLCVQSVTFRASIITKF